MRSMYCNNIKINCYNYKINFYYSQQTPESNFSRQDQTQVFARGNEDDWEFSRFWRCRQRWVSSTNGGMLKNSFPLYAILFTVPPQLLWLSGLIPSLFPDIFPALTALSLYTICCLWHDTSEKQERLPRIQHQNTVRPYHHLDSLNKVQLRGEKSPNKNQPSSLLHKQQQTLHSLQSTNASKFD